MPLLTNRHLQDKISIVQCGMLRRILTRPEFAIFILLSIFLLPLCGLIFQCGCTYLWAGADSHCNIHVSGKPDCPWCISPFHNITLSLLAQMIPFVLIFVASCIGSRASRTFGATGYVKPLVAGIIVGLVVMILVAWIYGRIYHYPFFLFK